MSINDYVEDWFEAEVEPSQGETGNTTGIQVTRRAFLGGISSIPAVTVLPGAALASDASKDVDLRFLRSADGKEVVVRIVQETIPKLDEKNLSTSGERRLAPEAWVIDIRSFGPEAEFQLQRLKGRSIEPKPGQDTWPRYKLIIKSTRFGRFRSGDQIFEFMRRVLPGGQPRWYIRARTNLWQDATDKKAALLGDLTSPKDSDGTTAPLDLRRFLSGDGHLERITHSSTASKTLRWVFNNLAAPIHSRTRLRFEPDATWTLLPRDAKDLNVAEVLMLGIKVPKLFMGWSLPDGDQGGAVFSSGVSSQFKIVAPESRFTSNLPKGAATGVVAFGIPDPADEIDLEVGESPRIINLVWQPKKNHLTQVVLRVRDPRNEVKKIVLPRVAEAALHAPWQLSVITDDVVTGPFKQIQGILRRTAKDTRKSISSDTKSFAQTTVFGAGFQSDKAERIKSRLGPLIISGILGEAGVNSKSKVAEKASDTGTEHDLEAFDVRTELPDINTRSDGDAESGSTAIPLLHEQFQTSIAFDFSPSNPFADFRGMPVRVAAERKKGGFNSPASLTWFEATVHLLEASPKLEQASFSQLRFDGTELNLLFAPGLVKTPLRGSFIRLDDVFDGLPIARLDLTRAQLRAARDRDLASLAFRFANMALLFAKSDGGQVSPEIVSYSDQCLTLAGPGKIPRDLPPRDSAIYNKDGAAEAQSRTIQDSFDSRPLMVVEFPPQHVMEQAWLLPALPPIPDSKVKAGANGKRKFLIALIDDQGGQVSYNFSIEDRDADTETSFDENLYEVYLNNPDGIIELLRRVTAIGDRREVRELIQEQKIYNAVDQANGKKLEDFAIAFKKLANRRPHRRPPARELPEDQRVYIGPIALDADASILARSVQREGLKKQAAALAKDMFHQVEIQAGRILNQPDRFPQIQAHVNDFGAALALERVLESTVPSYQVFRSFYREWMTDEVLANPKSGLDLDPRNIEYVLGIAKPENRKWPGAEALRNRDKLPSYSGAGEVHSARKAYIAKLTNEDGIQGLAEGRHSARSRLAFRVNCRDGLALARQAVKALHEEGDEDLGLGRGPMKFSLEDLTDWSSLELSVVRRAQNVYQPGIGGRLDASSGRNIDLSVSGRLDQLGFQSGAGATAADRLADVERSLMAPPRSWETDIVLPSRLSLSTSQAAVFLTPRPVPASIFSDERIAIVADEKIWPGEANMEPLWTARLFTEGLEPGLRVIHSPDLRPGFVWSGLNERDADFMVPDHRFKQGNQGPLNRLPGNGPPPGGPVAPWLIGPEETTADVEPAHRVADGLVEQDLDASTQKQLSQIFEDLKEADNETAGGQSPADRDAEFCRLVEERAEDGSLKLPGVIGLICRRVFARSRTEFWRQRRKFRTPLSANDRHQLVVLSSAHGLPVMGRRDLKFNLVADSSQVEPDERFRLIDVMPGSAIYRPRPLGVKELTLTALGGSFRHDTSFEPPASARHISDRNLFDALSIERWQHWTVLGRDVFAEVVYKGFLIPFGHRASLVKVTERTFLRDKKSRLVRAYLRQRIFIRCGKPEKLFPAIDQPNGGRAFSEKIRVEILTTQTPDIVDPYEGASTDQPFKVTSSGRIHLGEFAGLVFWPRTAQIAGAEVRFEFTKGGKFSEMPFIFIDNVAANNEKMLKALTDYYNVHVATPDAVTKDSPADGPLTKYDPKVHLRSFLTRGEKFPYCQELKTGSATYPTEMMTLRIEGRERKAPDVQSVGSPIVIYSFKNDRFNFTPVLQGADQPPIYPVLESSRILLRQNERLTGRRARPVRAVFDGNYLIQGLPVPKSDDETEEDLNLRAAARVNGMQIFMSLIDQPSQDMGRKGDQSGGVFRPAGKVIGLSRSKGLVTSSGGITGLQNSISSIRSGLRLSIAENHTTKPDRGLDVQSLGTLSGPDRVRSDLSNLKREAKEIYNSLLSDDTKILGLVEVRKLLNLLGNELQKPESGAPALAEKIRYGVQQAEDAGENLTDMVRQQIARPLAGVVRDIRSRWNDLEKTLKANQGLIEGVTTPVTLAELFPELDTGLDALDAALQKALQIDDDLGFAFELAEVFEAGQAFLAAVQATASSPVERFETALKRRFQDVQNFATSTLKALESLAAEYLKLLKQTIAEAVAELAVPTKSGGPYKWLHLPVPFPRIPGDRDDTDWTGESMEVQKVQKALREIYLDDTEARKVVEHAVKHLLTGASIKDIFDKEFKFKEADTAEPLKKILQDLLEKRAHETLDALKKLVPMISDMAAEKLLGEAIKAVEQFQRYLDQQFDAFIEAYAREILFVTQLMDDIETIKTRLEGNDYQGAARTAIDLIEKFTGPLGFSVEKVCRNWNVGGVLGQAARAMRFENFALARPKLDNNQSYDEAKVKADCANGNWPVVFMVPTAADDPISWRLRQLFEQIEDITAKANDPKIDKVITDLETASTNADLSSVRDKIEDLIETADKGIAGTRRALSDLRQPVIDTYCDLQIDAMRLEAVESAFEALFAELFEDPSALDPKLKNLCEQDRVGEALRTLIDAAQQFAAGREKLIKNTGNNLREIAEVIQDFVNDQDVQFLLTAGAMGLAVDQIIASTTDANVKAILGRLKTTLEGYVRDVEVASGKLGLRIACFLHDTVVRLAGLVKFVHTQAEKLKDLVEEAVQEGGEFGLAIEIAGLRDNLGTIQELQEFLDSVAKGIRTKILPSDKAVAGAQVALKDLNKKIQVAGIGDLPALTFAEVTIHVDGNAKGRVDQLLAAMENALKQALAELEDRGRKWLGKLRREVLETLDPIVTRVLNVELGIGDERHGALHFLYRKLIVLREDVIKVAPNQTFRAAISAALTVDPRTGDVTKDFPDKQLDAVEPALKPLPEEPYDRLIRDTMILQKIASGATAKPISDEKQRRYLATFAREWGNATASIGERPTPVVMVTQVGDVVAELIRGDFLQLIDLNVLRAEIEEYLLSLVPTEFELGYGFSTPMSSSMRAATAGIFEPDDGTSFDINLKIVIKLTRASEGIRPELTSRSVGKIGRFNINLVGSFDCVTLIFSGARFISESGAKSTFKVDYEDFKIGRQLEFVQQLQSYFFPGKDGTGFYLEPRTSPIGIEAGYALDLGIISFGNVSFFNVAVVAAAILPFEDAKARFKGSLSRRFSPFTISYAPYGGSGFFAIEADAKGIIGFEASFEFGGAAAFGFGPLTGQGRLMTGVYVRQQSLSGIGKVTEISSTFYAGGSAGIWIFSFGASLYVRLGMVNGDMTGEAIFTYSFSIGIKDFDFSIPVFRKEGKGFQNRQQATLSPELRRTMFASSGLQLAGFEHPGLPDLSDMPLIEKNTVCQGRNWGRFHRYFDSALGDGKKFIVEDGF